MKRIFLIVLTAIFSCSFGQISKFGAPKIRKKQEVPVEFTRNDGTTFKALLMAPKDNKGEDKSYMIEALYDEFEYKMSADSKKEKIAAKEIKGVKFLEQDDDESLGMERLKLKTMNVKGELVDKAYDDFAPLLYDGKIKIYGSNVVSCYEGGTGCQYLYTKIYLKNRNSDYAIAPLDYDRINLFNISSIDDKMFAALKAAGNNCENFNKYLDGVIVQSKNKAFREEMKKTGMAYYKEAFKVGKEQKLSARQTQELLGSNMMQLYLNFYGGFVREYEKNCP